MDPERIGDTAAFADLRQRAHQLAARPDLSARTRTADEQDAAKILAELETAREARWRAAVPGRFVNARIGQLDGPFRRVADEWVGRGMGCGVMLIGPPGVGKTHAAVAMLRAAYEAGRTVGVGSALDILADLRPGGNRTDWVSFDVLAIDDLGVQKQTDWEGETFDGIVDGRWRDGLPTIVTSNLTPDVLADHVGPRMWSRLYHDAIRTTIAGQDRRATA